MAVEPRRLQVWQALSALFLDTEVDDATFEHIAHVVLESGYSAADIQHILWAEVFPVLAANLHSITGEWAGWPDAWLLEHLRVREGQARPPRFGFVAAEIRRCWEQITARLPADFQAQQ